MEWRWHCSHNGKDRERYIERITRAVEYNNKKRSQKDKVVKILGNIRG